MNCTASVGGAPLPLGRLWLFQLDAVAGIPSDLALLNGRVERRPQHVADPLAVGLAGGSVEQLADVLSGYLGRLPARVAEPFELLYPAAGVDAANEARRPVAGVP
jgi:hypothetical protein